MKILLDECVTRKLKQLMTGFDVWTVSEMGYSGLKNGKLLEAAQGANFDLLLTIDKHIDSQQNISKFNLTLVIFDTPRSTLTYLQPLLATFREQIDSFEKGQVYWVK